VLYLLARSQYTTPALAGVADKEARIAELADVGWWISSQLGRETTSRVGKALRARREREKQQAEKPKPKL
jgi:hydroxymethylglutaryl-CoA lyase